MPGGGAETIILPLSAIANRQSTLAARHRAQGCSLSHWSSGSVHVPRCRPKPALTLRCLDVSHDCAEIRE